MENNPDRFSVIAQSRKQVAALAPAVPESLILFTISCRPHADGARITWSPAYKRYLTDSSSILSPHSYSFKSYRQLSMNRLNSHGEAMHTFLSDTPADVKPESERDTVYLRARGKIWIVIQIERTGRQYLCEESRTIDCNMGYIAIYAIRYVKDGVVNESLLMVKTTENLDAATFTELTLNTLTENNIDPLVC
ncbi:hypothetical protein EVAR_93695_1 [Eumeta japonica]|uniref:Uncharacterized protein n=1 Tax=Eumeta variegata TaxID=151549 RepID=A0A4C1U2N6_EUMVA|nr:hypothetical protein EVAR_93695_1 [Eumeta japonica]